ncbi:MAG: alpha/beta fold hydrolase [Ignavibacteria bacterium]|nr:alpha/beta fold hydrolase [Ignavibacteria bacterium]
MKKLLLLHGAIGAASQFDKLKKELKGKFDIYSMNFSGHGGEIMPDKFSIELFADDVVKYLEKNNLENIDIFGYSMGGYVALYNASRHKNKINRIFTVATKFDWNEESSVKESKMLNPAKIEEKIPAFAKALEKRHSVQNWKIVMNKTAEMMIGLGKKPVLTDEVLGKIENEVLISVGDKDAMVTLEETANAAGKLKNGSLFIFSDTEHPIEKMDVKKLSNEIIKFFN